MSQSPDLLEFAKNSVKKIADEFTSPDADFLGTLLIKAHDGNVHIVGMAGDMNSQDEKDDMARFMFAAVACLRAKEAAFVNSAWAVKVAKQEYEAGEMAMPRDNPNRIEVVNIMYAGTNGDMLSTSEITRHEDEGKPPTIGDWEDMGGEGTTVGGRFGDAIHDGLEVGQELGIAPPEMAEYMNEKIAKGELADLVESFLRAMDRAREEHKKEQQ